MKIGPLDNKPPLAGPAAERKAPAAPTSATTPEPSAKVELSAAAGVLASGLAEGSFDAEKVERLSRAIRDGTYRIDADAIADKLLANARELIQRGSN